METPPPQRYVETFASISFATTMSIVIHQISRYPNIFGDPTSPFRIASIAVLAGGFVLLFWATIVKYCPRIARCLKLDRLEVYDYHGDVNRVISMFLPLGITFILSSWMTTSDYNSAIANSDGGIVFSDSYALALWISAGISVLLFIVLLRNARMQRLELSHQQLDSNSASLSGVQETAKG
ncbi:hypothetical protein [Candidatus Poriferisocius sp.]|uniref:hypothetical protein n=1 Tax=Candidatus Poriferisocius sp. TaxID=3101276 RepID=UPI003B0157AE